MQLKAEKHLKSSKISPDPPEPQKLKSCISLYEMKKSKANGTAIKQVFYANQ